MVKKVRDNVKQLKTEVKIYFKYLILTILGAGVYFFMASNVQNWMSKQYRYDLNKFIFSPFFTNFPSVVFPWFPITKWGMGFVWFRELFGITDWINCAAKESWENWANILNGIKYESNSMTNHTFALLYPIIALIAVSVLFLWSFLITSFTFLTKNFGLCVMAYILFWYLKIASYKAIYFLGIIPALQIFELIVDIFIKSFTINGFISLLKGKALKILVFMGLPIFLIYMEPEWTHGITFGIISLLALFCSNLS